MRKKVLFSSFILLFLSVAAFGIFTKNKESQIEDSDKISRILNESYFNAQKTLVPEVRLGDINAKIILTMYGSYTCYHCAHQFSSLVEKLEKDYINKGIIQFNFIASLHNSLDLIVEKLILCGVSEDKRINFIDFIYKTQEKWVAQDLQTSKERAKIIFKEGGIDTQKFESCINSSKFDKKIMNQHNFMVKNLDINATPIIILGDYKLQGYTDYETVKDLIEKIQKDSK